MDVEAFYDKIQSQLDQQLPFVVYKKPEENTVYSMLQWDDDLHKMDSYQDTGFVFAPFDVSGSVLLLPEKRSTQYSCTLSDPSVAYKKQKSVSVTTQKKYNSADKKEYIKLVQEAIRTIKTGVLKKVVLSRQEEVSCADNDLLRIFRRLIAQYPEAFIYCWYHPKIGLWIGATPEVLLEMKGQDFFTMALAATQSYIDSMVVDWGAKEVAEQAMVTDFIVRGLSAVASAVFSSQAYTHKAGSLLHLRTDIKAKLDQRVSIIQDVIDVLHPTPAVCGLPKKEATSFILKNEGYDRKYYTGFLGELNMKNGNNRVDRGASLFVNLRCMELKKDTALIYVGGGITEDSNPEKEWEETIKKAEIMKMGIP